MWGCIKSGGRTLVKVDRNLNTENYINLLWSNLMPDYEEIFQHDSAPCHACSTFGRLASTKVFI